MIFPLSGPAEESIDYLMPGAAVEPNKGIFVQPSPQLPHSLSTVGRFTRLLKSSSSNAPHLCTGCSQRNRSLVLTLAQTREWAFLHQQGQGGE